MKKDNEQTLIEIEELINEAIRSPYIEELINAEEFYFQHLLNVKDAFFDYSISESEIERIIEDYEAYKDGTFEDYVIQSDESVDRKSTRLNSSHVAISYAVFCLKKTKNR